MLPEFPNFKNLELSDREDVEKITKRFPPYSDFNFTSMWCWNINDEVKISTLNNNLVVRFTDYLTRESFYSFIGENSTINTAKELLKFSLKESGTARLKLVPEHSMKLLGDSTFDIKEDQDNFDYLIPVEILQEYSTPKTKSRKRSANQFQLHFPHHSIEPLDLANPTTAAEIYSFFDPLHPVEDHTTENERVAITRFIDNCRKLSYFAIGIYLHDKLVAFYIGELSGPEFTIGHFWKADTSVSPGLYSFLMREVARFLAIYDYKYINIEQDLGLENLRKWKSSYGSEVFLKKYIVVYKT